MLSRKHPLTINMIRKLTEEMRIPAEVLIRPYDVKRGNRGLMRRIKGRCRRSFDRGDNAGPRGPVKGPDLARRSPRHGRHGLF
jgi:hypothetical protein